jgi:WD40 repeat protein
MPNKGRAVAMSRLLAGGLFLACLLAEPCRSEPPPANKKPATPRTDRYGDPLPEGAISRLGTLRFRHSSQVTSVAYSPDGRFLATGGHDSTIRLWQAFTGKELFRFTLPATRSPFAALVAYSPDGKTLAARGEHTLYLLDASTGKERNKCLLANKENITALAFSPDGKSLAAVCWGQNRRQRGPPQVYSRIRLWRVKTAEEVYNFEAPEGDNRTLAFAPDGKTLVVGQDHEICMCDAATGRKLRTLQRSQYYNGFSPAVAVSANGLIASVTTDEKVVRLWDATTGRQKRALPAPKEIVHEGAGRSLAFSADGKRLVSASVGDSCFHVWDVAQGKIILAHRGLASISGGCAVLSPDGKTVAEGRSVNHIHALRRWDVATGKEILAASGHLVPVGFVAFTPDDRIVTSGAGLLHDVGLRVWNARNGRQLTHLEEKNDVIWRVTLSPDGRTAAAAKHKGAVLLWDVDTGKELKKLASDAGWIGCLSFAPDGKTLAVGRRALTKPYACTLHLWDVASGEAIRQWRVPGSGFQAVAFHPNGKQLVSLAEGLRLWDVVDGKEVGAFPLPRGEAVHNLICFSPDGVFLAAPCSNKGFAVWDVAKRDLIGRFDDNGQASRTVAFSPDGRLLACGNDDSTIELWETLTWTLAGRRQGPAGWVCAIGFSPNGQLLASGHEDTTALIWDVPSLWAPAENTAALTKEQLEALWTQLGSRQAAARPIGPSRP